MKFAVVVVLLAVALGIEASGLAWGAHYAPALSYTAVSGPAAHGAWGHGAWAGPAAWGHGAWAGPAAWGAHGAWAAPAAVDVSHGAYGHGAWGHGAWGHGAWSAPAVAVHAPAAVAVHAPTAVAAHAAIAPAAHAWGHEGSYVAQTRGATHVAPLAGHAHSAAAINVHPAPGTI
ncbi:adult cuticle protein 1-like [Hermetia illucens]|uniref:adult cuticle protein 1-like n=1 Tax=Hermetia illucens TaxID=343691 RepID=UPI0018CC5AA1|nr:adult cuticle protein 1-like [Hermetia illucens]